MAEFSREQHVAQQHVYDAIKAARNGQANLWLSMYYERVLYRFQLVAMRPLADDEEKPYFHSLQYRGTTLVPINPADWGPGYGWCIAKVHGRVRLAQLTDDIAQGRFRINGAFRDEKDIFAVVKGGWQGTHARKSPCEGGFTQQGFLPGSHCPTCRQWFDKPPGQPAPKHIVLT